MKKLGILILFGMIAFNLHAESRQVELDLYGNQQPPRIETVPQELSPVPDDTETSTRFPPNRDVSDIPTTEITISPTRSKTVTRTISRPSSYPRQDPVVIDPVIAPMIYPGPPPYPHH